ncbi:serine hydrolase domain-containing protein [Actinocorallia longicatena]|uniref:Serine hydrolase domain-containing protein n=1 Tax=Actinocorallia longicatena TaxID=111803 RepID=A0ABP6QBH8_9ACTN
MTNLREVLGKYVESGVLPGAVGLVARGGRAEVAAVGVARLEDGAVMRRDAVFRVASITKMVTAAAAMMLVEDGVAGLGEPVARWLPELAEPMVVRVPGAPLDDVVAAVRPVTVEHLLTSTCGYGFSSGFSEPAVVALSERVQRDGREPQGFLPAEEWVAELARIPLLYQPGERYLYNTSYDLLGVLVARASGRSFGEFLAERIFEPLGMVDSGFVIRPGQAGRMTSYYRGTAEGELELADPAGGAWSDAPPLESGAGGLLGTADDWLAFCRMLLAGGVSGGGRRVLSPESVRLMTTDRLGPAQRGAGALFLDGQSWGFGGSVDIAMRDPWNVPGRYGWVGGTGTIAYVIPSTGTVTVLMTQVAAESPAPSEYFNDFWRYAATAFPA